MLLETLDSFEATEFWYAEKGSISNNSTRVGSFRKIIQTQTQPQPQRKEEKWWLPVVCVPSGGLSEKARKHLRHKRGCANQIHKAAMAINSSILAEMEIPESYMASLPKSEKACVGDSMYRHMYTAEKFSPEYLLDSLNISSEHEALELADKVEASMYTWRHRTESLLFCKGIPNFHKQHWTQARSISIRMLGRQYWRAILEYWKVWHSTLLRGSKTFFL